MNAWLIPDRIEEQSWARHYQQIAREETEAELADDLEKGLPQHLFESLCIDNLQRHGASKKAISRAFDDMSIFRNAWQNTSATWLKPSPVTKLILIQRYKTDEYSTRNAGREAG
ncbi:host-nuclease inhibitor Gam family protein [Escherichia coli 2-474-04_S3_C1]|nr:host-nuclease inhibitor Gam family protein [Escherichia coli 2-474-04_S3_C1]